MKPEPVPATQSDAIQSRGVWLRRVFETYHGPLFGYALRMTGGRRDWAEEAVQESFLRLCRQESGSVDGHVKAWLFKVCRTRIIDMQRTDHAPPPTVDGDGDHRGERSRHAVQEPPDAALLRDEETDRLRRSVEALPERQRELLHLRIHGQLSYREMAEATGLSVTNVGYLLHQAMRNLRDQMVTATD
jgi:RNA polymerase sigma-70 factor (ECF subfamily)